MIGNLFGFKLTVACDNWELFKSEIENVQYKV